MAWSAKPSSRVRIPEGTASRRAGGAVRTAHSRILSHRPRRARRTTGRTRPPQHRAPESRVLSVVMLHGSNARVSGTVARRRPGWPLRPLYCHIVRLDGTSVITDTRSHEAFIAAVGPACCGSVLEGREADLARRQRQGRRGCQEGQGGQARRRRAEAAADRLSEERRAGHRTPAGGAGAQARGRSGST